MKCPVCNHENGDAHFCERCGSNLTQTTSSPTPVPNPESAASEPEYTRWSSTQATSSEASVPSNTPSVSIHKEQARESTGTNDHASAGDNSSNQWNNIVQNEKVQQAKEVSKQYLSYFLSVLARPYQTMKTVGDQHSLNGWLTMALIAVLSSTYFLITFSRIGMDGLFIGGFLRPLLFTVIILIASIALMYAILKIEKITLPSQNTGCPVWYIACSCCRIPCSGESVYYHLVFHRDLIACCLVYHYLCCSELGAVPVSTESYQSSHRQHVQRADRQCGRVLYRVSIVG
ncbi:hypothetical protein [Paenibacillus sp. W2I17]|uniref:hypothetical protein n=1 Tax=Paenibacillus sp. W2I17 TaxID=3042311 RepID=UPI00278B84B6|nr:hypothetical protein [Paenibacillus sp. W2I17]MDQ0659781.1 hypothetical protein [Paenibacillus sp. W2I17]